MTKNNFKMYKSLSLDDTDLLESYTTKNSRLMLQYVIKFGTDSIARKLLSKKLIKNYWQLQKFILEPVQQLNLFSNES